MLPQQCGSECYDAVQPPTGFIKPTCSFKYFYFHYNNYSFYKDCATIYARNAIIALGHVSGQETEADAAELLGSDDHYPKCVAKWAPVN